LAHTLVNKARIFKKAIFFEEGYGLKNKKSQTGIACDFLKIFFSD